MNIENHNDELDRLIQLFLTDEITDDDMAKLHHMLEVSESARIHFSEMSAIWSALNTVKDPELDKKGKRMVAYLRNKRDTKMPFKRESKHTSITLMGAAAAIMLVAGLTFLLIKNDDDVVQPQATSIYSYTNEDEYVDPLYLQDGSVVWVGPYSSIEFQIKATECGIQRQAHVNGSAYFDVAKDSLRPFVVDAADFAVRVLGTKFIVESHPDSVSTKVYLQEGSVRLQTLDGVPMVRMVENQKAVFDKESSELEIESANVDSYINGQFNKISLLNRTIDEIVLDLSTIYNTSIEYNRTERSQTKYNFSFMVTDPLEEVLDFLEELTRHSFKIKEE